VSDRIAQLLAEVAALRAQERHDEEESSRKGDPFKTRAKSVYKVAVRIAGGPSPVADAEGVDESAVRRRVENPRLAVHLAHVLAMPADSIDHIAEELKRAATEKRGLRHAS
jgi:hypothetical protein